MERPFKRPRLTIPDEPEDGFDDVNLHEARFQNDQRLKSIFEGIFEKYGKDFTDVGDEIDLETGKIVVNHGHLDGLEGEGDTGSWALEPELSTSAGGNTDEAASVDGNNTHISEEQTWTGGEEQHGQAKPPQTLSSTMQLGVTDDGRWERKRSHEPADLTDGDVDANPEDDDDRSSVDSLLDDALSVQNGPDDRWGRKTADSDRAPVEKANTALETSTQSNVIPKHHGAEQPVESIWRVPEISGRFSTPTVNRTHPAPIFKKPPVRSPSPPGAGSLWALPGTSRKKKVVTTAKKEPKSEKKAATERKPRATKRKFTSHSSPIALDWSFAETPDGSESDDPLQEDFEPSPSPKKALHIRGKRNFISTPSRAEKRRAIDTPAARHPTVVVNQKPDEPQDSPAGKADPRDVNPLALPQAFDGTNDSSDIQHQTAPANQNHYGIKASLAANANAKEIDPSTLPEMASTNTPKPEASKKTSDGIKDSSAARSYSKENDPPTLPDTATTNTPKPKLSKGSSPVQNSTPSSNKRTRSFFTPDEVKLLIISRQVHLKRWKDIVNDHFPQKKELHLIQWNQSHWINRRNKRPKLTRPWSQAELDKLDQIKDQANLTWPEIRAEFSGRTLAEIEFELLRLWVGDDVSNDNQKHKQSGLQKSSEQAEAAGPGNSEQQETPGKRAVSGSVLPGENSAMPQKEPFVQGADSPVEVKINQPEQASGESPSELPDNAQTASSSEAQHSGKSRDGDDIMQSKISPPSQVMESHNHSNIAV